MFFRLKHLLSPESSGRTTAPETSSCFQERAERTAPRPRGPHHATHGGGTASPFLPSLLRSRAPRAPDTPPQAAAARAAGGRLRRPQRAPPPPTSHRAAGAGPAARHRAHGAGRATGCPGRGGSRRRAPRGGHTTAVLGRRPRHEGNGPRRRKRLKSRRRAARRGTGTYPW